MPLKIASFTMMRNESPILGPFLDQLHALFDLSCIVDHQSIDSSVETIRNRKWPGLELLHLKSMGYPQSQLATIAMQRVFERTDADWLFFLDCDEFLPFANRDSLVAALDNVSNSDYVHLFWRNAAPDFSAVGDIFSGSFETTRAPSFFRKIAVSRKMFEKYRELTVLQGYHGVASSDVLPESICLSDVGLFHIPITSRIRFAAKIKHSGQKIINDSTLFAKGQGFHWANYYMLLRDRNFDSFDFRTAALTYPFESAVDESNIIPLDFKFDYVLSKYNENIEELFRLYFNEADNAVPTDSFLLYADDGEVIFSNAIDIAFEPVFEVARSDGTGFMRSFSINEYSHGETYSDLIEPLFSLPLKLPGTAWTGHIPFLMMLIRLMRPKNYVELGVHMGASLIAAATASQSFQVPMQLYGIDSWEGDVHAGLYEGDPIFNDLRLYTDKMFRNVNLIRSYFDDANPRFMPGSIDVLHIDGLHTYDAVKSDFTKWLPKMRADGVILFHDTCVLERGFGVYRFWEELEGRFTTINFKHSFGLGVILLDPTSDRLAPLVRIAKNTEAARFYISLTSQLGSILHSRMHYLDLLQNGRPSEQEAHETLTKIRAHTRSLEFEKDNLALRVNELSSRLSEREAELAFRRRSN